MARKLSSIIVLVLAALLAFAGGASAQEGTTYWYQGTGPTGAAPQVIIDQAAADETDLVNMSGDRGWQANFKPAHGETTADESVASGVALGSPNIKKDLEDGKRVVIKGFSLGSLAAGDLGVYLAKEGVDIRNMKFTLIADGHTPETGALIALQPLKPLLDVIGITPGPREVPSVGQWEYVCINGDGTCDLPDVLRDPVTALDNLVGYFTKHGGTDPKYNYWNLENLDSRTYVDGNVVTTVYDAPRALPRLVELYTGSVELSERLDAVMDKITTSSGDAGQEKVYKTIPEIVRDVASLFDPQAPLLPTTVEEVPQFVGEIAGELVESGAPKVGGAIGETVGTYLGTQLGGPAGGVTLGQIGQQVGTDVGEQVGPVLAPVVDAAVTAGVDYVLTGNTDTSGIESAINNQIPPVVPFKAEVPELPQLPFRPLVPAA